MVAMLSAQGRERDGTRLVAFGAADLAVTEPTHGGAWARSANETDEQLVDDAGERSAFASVEWREDFFDERVARFDDGARGALPLRGQTDRAHARIRTCLAGDEAVALEDVDEPDAA